MLCVVSFFTGDREQAVRWSEWVNELGPYPTHDLLIVRDHRAEPIPHFGDSFRAVNEIVIRDDAYDSWPSSPNLMFRRAGKHIEYGTKEPWLWLEVDSCPLKTGWLDAIEAEYREAGKPFLGDFVHLNEPGFRSHMSGVAVYPGILSHFAGTAYHAHETAWDVVAASQIIPQMHQSKLILHKWKHPTFENWQQVEERIFAVKPEAVLFHASKDGSLIRLLRERKDNLSGRAITAPDKGALEVTQPAMCGSSVPPAQNITTDILIKSFPPDYERLRYCLRSIDKFASGFSKVKIICDELTDPPWHDDDWRPSNVTIKWQNVTPRGEGYLFQQTVKAQAHDYTDADYILHIDSDCIFTEPVTPAMFMRDGKPIWYKTPYSSGLEVPWEAITEKFMQAPVEYEFMRRFPFLVPRFLHEAIAAFCLETHGKSLTDYILSQPIRAFSEFNALGALAYSQFRDRFHWIDTTTDEVPERVVIQKWSHEKFSDADKAEFEEILREDPAPVDWDKFEQDAKPGTPTIRSLAEQLKGFMGNSVETRRVRNVLHEVGVIELPYRFKRRRGWKRKKAKAT